MGFLEALRLLSEDRREPAVGRREATHLFECRDCGHKTHEDSSECPSCGSTEIAHYQFSAHGA